MNQHMFSLWGYLSVALWLLVPALLAVHWVRRPRRWLCHYALGVALLAYGLAKINSVTHVGRIQLDQSAEIAAGQAKVLAGRKAAEQSRGADVAQIRFAEDATGDFLDKGGMDEADLKYMEKITEGGEPAWKQAKKKRSGSAPDDSLESAIGAGEENGQGAPDVSRIAEAGEPLMMMEKDRSMANRLDGANLLLIRLLILAALVVVIADYLARANRYAEAYLPLPLPSSWVNGLTPLPPVTARPSPARRTMVEDLAWLARRGDAFVYLAGDPAAAAAVPERLARLPRGKLPADVLRAGAGDRVVDDVFVFEALWYNRASFVMPAARPEAFLASAAKLLRRRMETGARVQHTVHVVWDAGRPMPEALRGEFVALAGATGWTVMESTAIGSGR